MQITWTEGGKQHVGTTRPRYVEAFRRLDWKAPHGLIGAMPALGIQSAIRTLRLPKVSAIAVSSDLAPFGLYGIEANDTNGRAHIYVLDLGSELVPVATEFYPKTEGVSA